ncbi:DUF2804 domain-containing protein [Prescottella equi]|uniref:DUF2804 domain-containing protein n=1 Tax=Rhodococcus hoagii TaxID=43767 RepID=UPI000A0F5426|nr:DUF2804 domain-containing protein [Prescottella equi]NKR40804.1 DUF2804 family protein [Prescottella equi]ORJ95399.1 hypothetical protein A6F58_13710 [Prescottella equi]
MQHRLQPGPLLDESGHLAEAGWADAEVRRYDRAAVTAPSWRIKEWDYYCVLTPEHGLALTVADNGYMGLLGVSWLDLRNRREVTENVMLPFPLGRMGLPASADTGDVVVEHKKMRIAFRHDAGGRVLSIDHPRFDGGRGLRGELRLARPDTASSGRSAGSAPARMVIATPFPKAPKAFYYNQKMNCLPATGQVTVGGDTVVFEPESAFGVFDWGRGVWTYDNTWYWGSASGVVDGRPFGFNIGYGFGDTSAASENMVFVGGVAHKLDRVMFHLPEGTYDGAPWKFSSNDGRFEMVFEPILDRAAAVDFKVLRSIQHQVFGRFTGHVVLDDGSRMEVTDLLGFAEEVRNRW